MKFEDYLERLQKTEEVIRTESREPAIKRAKTGLLLHAISNKEQIVPDKEKMDAEVDRIMGMYQDADIKAVQHYVEGILKNEAVFKLLEESTN